MVGYRIGANAIHLHDEVEAVVARLFRSVLKYYTTTTTTTTTYYYYYIYMNMKRTWSEDVPLRLMGHVSR